jgi:hypothetical protein
MPESRPVRMPFVVSRAGLPEMKISLPSRKRALPVRWM